MEGSQKIVDEAESRSKQPNPDPPIVNGQFLFYFDFSYFDRKL